MIILKFDQINIDDIVFDKIFSCNTNISINCNYLYNNKKIPLIIQKRQKLKYLDHEIKLTVKIITHLVLKIPNTITMGELFMCCTNLR